jgi:hypothetical protein
MVRGSETGFGAKFCQELQSSLAARLAVLLGESGGSGFLTRRAGVRRAQAKLADVPIFFEPVELEQVGKFESPDVAASSPYFPLQIGDDPAEMFCGITGAKEVKPGVLAVKAQTQALAGQLAVKGVSLKDLFGGEGGFHGEGDWGGL